MSRPIFENVTADMLEHEIVGGDVTWNRYPVLALSLTVILTVIVIAGSLSAAAAPAAGVPYLTGDVFAGVNNGRIQHVSPTGALLDSLTTGLGPGTNTTGMAFDASGNLYVTDFHASAVSKFGGSGNLLGTFGSGFTNNDPESIVFDTLGNAYVGQSFGTRQVLKFDPSGTLLASYSPMIENPGKGTDWVDLAADQCTLFYTSEAAHVKRFNVCTNMQLPDFNGMPLPGINAFALRIRPNGEVLVADGPQAIRLDAAGNQIKTYTIPGETFLFALNLDPDGTSFWTAGGLSGTIYRIDIASGTVLKTFSAGPAGTRVGGLAVFNQIVVGQMKHVYLPIVFNHH